MISFFNLEYWMNKPVYDIIFQWFNLDNKRKMHHRDGIKDSAFRRFGIYQFGAGYCLSVTVDVNVLLNGRESVECPPLRALAMDELDRAFKRHLTAYFGDEMLDLFPPMENWVCPGINYCVDIPVRDSELLMGIYRKTDMLPAHTVPEQAEYGHRYSHIKYLEAYPKDKLLELGRIDYKGAITPELIASSGNVIRLMVYYTRSTMGKVDNICKRFGLVQRKLASIISPIVVCEIMLKNYEESIGTGRFYTYKYALQIVQNSSLDEQNKQALYRFLSDLKMADSIPAVRKMYEMTSTGKTRFDRDLSMLRKIGVNGALLDADCGMDEMDNPYYDLFKICSSYSTD